MKKEMSEASKQTNMPSNIEASEGQRKEQRD